MKSLEHRLMVYKSRLKDQISQEDIDFYLDEIDKMESELEADRVIEDLKEECKLIPPWTCSTDVEETVKDLIANAVVVHIDIKWNWWKFKPVFYVEFYHKRV